MFNKNMTKNFVIGASIFAILSGTANAQPVNSAAAGAGASAIATASTPTPVANLSEEERAEALTKLKRSNPELEKLLAHARDLTIFGIGLGKEIDEAIENLAIALQRNPALLTKNMYTLKKIKLPDQLLSLISDFAGISQWTKLKTLHNKVNEQKALYKTLEVTDPEYSPSCFRNMNSIRVRIIQAFEDPKAIHWPYWDELMEVAMCYAPDHTIMGSKNHKSYREYLNLFSPQLSFADLFQFLANKLEKPEDLDRYKALMRIISQYQFRETSLGATSKWGSYIFISAADRGFSDVCLQGHTIPAPEDLVGKVASYNARLLAHFNATAAESHPAVSSLIDQVLRQESIYLDDVPFGHQGRLIALQKIMGELPKFENNFNSAFRALGEINDTEISSWTRDANISKPLKSLKNLYDFLFLCNNSPLYWERSPENTELAKELKIFVGSLMAAQEFKHFPNLLRILDASTDSEQKEFMQEFENSQFNSRVRCVEEQLKKLKLLPTPKPSVVPVSGHPAMPKYVRRFLPQEQANPETAAVLPSDTVPTVDGGFTQAHGRYVVPIPIPPTARDNTRLTPVPIPVPKLPVPKPMEEDDARSRK